MLSYLTSSVSIFHLKFSIFSSGIKPQGLSYCLWLGEVNVSLNFSWFSLLLVCPQHTRRFGKFHATFVASLLLFVIAYCCDFRFQRRLTQQSRLRHFFSQYRTCFGKWAVLLGRCFVGYRWQEIEGRVTNAHIEGHSHADTVTANGSNRGGISLLQRLRGYF